MLKFFANILGVLLDFVQTIVTAFLIFIVIYLFLLQPHQVKGNSMQPNFENNEYLLTDKISYRFNSPKRGDVVIFESPTQKNYDYIKRIIGLPNERIKLQDSKFYINDKLLDESAYLPANVITSPGEFLKSGKDVTVPDNQFFVVGDNRPHSSDSREWGFIPKESIIGKAWFRYWPPSRWGLIPRIAS